MKIIVGCNFCAKENNPRTNFCDSPNHFSVKVETCKLMNVAPDSAARAFASMVLPHPVIVKEAHVRLRAILTKRDAIPPRIGFIFVPGGPYNKTPFGAPSNPEAELKS
jgi:hypothetical protein